MGAAPGRPRAAARAHSDGDPAVSRAAARAAREPRADRGEDLGQARLHRHRQQHQWRDPQDPPRPRRRLREPSLHPDRHRSRLSLHRAGAGPDGTAGCGAVPAPTPQHRPGRRPGCRAGSARRAGSDRRPDCGRGADADSRLACARSGRSLDRRAPHHRGGHRSGLAATPAHTGDHRDRSPADRSHGPAAEHGRGAPVTEPDGRREPGLLQRWADGGADRAARQRRPAAPERHRAHVRDALQERAHARG